jgi:O-antigen ligase/polysaccharide polymerase Wzy-like membrane protein
VALVWVEEDRGAFWRNLAVGAAVAVGIFALSYANGGFNSTTRAYAGIAAWWLLGIGAAIGIGGALTRFDRLALAAVGLLAAFAVWVLISVNWASDAERAFAQFNQVSLYVAVLAVALVLARMVPAYVLTWSTALALAVIAGVALVSRLFPSTFGVEHSAALTPINSRLSFPLGYWNGLGIEVALAYPLVLAIMSSRRSRAASALAAFVLPLLAAVMYLTSSRGAFVAAAVAVVAYLLLSPNRWGGLAATVVAGIAGAISVAVLHSRTELLNGTDTPLGIDQGHRAALWIGIACVVTGIVWPLLAELGRRIPDPPPAVGRATVGLIVVIAIVGIVAAHPGRRFDQFKTNASHYAPGQSFTTSHLTSSSGSGRWQFWTAAVDQFRAHPLNGGGAGSWQAYWLQHDTLKGFFSQFAHSVYLEALGELGIVGLLLLAGAVLCAAVGAVRSAISLRSTEIAAAASVGIAFFAAAAYDWVWQLAGIAVVGVGMLGLALGALPSTRAEAWERFGVFRPVLAIVAVAAVIPMFVVLAAGIHLDNSRTAVNAGDAGEAKSQALAAKAIEPWAASPYVQLARIEQAQRDYDSARAWLSGALSRSPRDWSLWYIAAQIDTQRGEIPLARREIGRARALNPSSSFLKTIGKGS